MTLNSDNPLVMLAMSTARRSPHSMDAAIGLARDRGSRLLAVFALEDDVIERLVERLSTEGWVGEKPTQSFYESVMAQRRELGEKKLVQVGQMAEDADVPFSGELVLGGFEEVVRRLAEEREPEVVVLTRRKRSEVSRFFLGSPAARLQEDLSCEVVLVDEE